MELVLALLGGAAGGSLICGISPKVSVSLGLSLMGGMVGGAAFFLLVSKITPGGSYFSGTADLGSLLGLMSIGFAGGILLMSLICIKRWRDLR
ncbi:MAG: hypothetical protein L3J33_05875 [Rhodobacteraceae bacterium]|nr:hypothetical protein [Paracoccaceae bacterium]